MARPAVTKSGLSWGASAGPTASRVIGKVIAKIRTPTNPSQRPRFSFESSEDMETDRAHCGSTFFGTFNGFKFF